MLSRSNIALVMAFTGSALLGFTTLIGSAQAPTAPLPAKVAPSTSPALIAKGTTAYGSLDCSDCHVLNAKGTAVGPDLSHIGATWTQARLMTVIRHPKQITPKGIMPAYAKAKISAKRLNALTAYLASLK